MKTKHPPNKQLENAQMTRYKPNQDLMQAADAVIQRHRAFAEAANKVAARLDSVGDVVRGLSEIQTELSRRLGVTMSVAEGVSRAVGHMAALTNQAEEALRLQHESIARAQSAFGEAIQIESRLLRTVLGAGLGSVLGSGYMTPFSAALQAKGDTILRTNLDSLPIGLGASVGRGVGTAITYFPDVVKPLMSAIAGLSATLNDINLGNGFEVALAERNAEALNHSLSSTFAAAAQVNVSALAESHPVLAQVVETVASGSDAYWDIEQPIVDRLESIDSTLKAMHSDQREHYAESESASKQQLNWTRAAVFVAVLIFLLEKVVPLAQAYVAGAAPWVESSQKMEPSVSADSHISLDIEGVIALALQELAGDGANTHYMRQRLRRNAPLRIEPHGKAREVCRLEEGSVVSLVYVHGPWARVEFEVDDERSGQMRGWVHRKHLSVP